MNAELVRHVCSACGVSKAKQAFAATGDVGEDLTLCRGCRGCRGEVKRAANRDRVASETDKGYGALKRGSATPPVGPFTATLPAIEAAQAAAPRVLHPAQSQTISDPAAPLVTPPAAPAFPVPAGVPPQERPYPAVRAVLRYLPASGTWTADDRARFILAFESAVDLEIHVTNGVAKG